MALLSRNSRLSLNLQSHKDGNSTWFRKGNFAGADQRTFPHIFQHAKDCWCYTNKQSRPEVTFTLSPLKWRKSCRLESYNILKVKYWSLLEDWHQKLPFTGSRAMFYGIIDSAITITNSRTNISRNSQSMANNPQMRPWHGRFAQQVNAANGTNQIVSFSRLNSSYMERESSWKHREDNSRSNRQLCNTLTRCQMR